MSKTLWICNSPFSVAVAKQYLSQLMKILNLALGSREIQDHCESAMATTVRRGCLPKQDTKILSFSTGTVKQRVGAGNDV